MDFSDYVDRLVELATHEADKVSQAQLERQVRHQIETAIEATRANVMYSITVDTLDLDRMHWNTPHGVDHE